MLSGAEHPLSSAEHGDSSLTLRMTGFFFYDFYA